MTARLNPDAKEFVPTFHRPRQYSPNTDVLFMSTSFNESEGSVESQRGVSNPEEMSHADPNLDLDENLKQVDAESEEVKKEFYVFEEDASTAASDNTPYRRNIGSSNLLNTHMGDGDHRTKLSGRSSKQKQENQNKATVLCHSLEKRVQNDKKVTIAVVQPPSESSSGGAQSHRCALNPPKATVSNSKLACCQRPRTAPMSGRTCDPPLERNLKTTLAATNLKNVSGSAKEVRVAPLQLNKSRVSYSISSSRGPVELKARPASSYSGTAPEAHGHADNIGTPKTPQNQSNNTRKPGLPRATVAFTLRRNEAMKKKNLIPGNTGKL